MATITFHPGSGVKDKAEYRLGKGKVPMSVITRLVKSLAGKTGSALDRVFYQGLAKYEAFLEAMEAANISPTDALKTFSALKPAKVGKLRLEKEAEGVAKILAKKYSSLAPVEMVEKFLATVSKPEFKEEVVNLLKSYEKQFKRNPLGRIRTSNRKANPKAIKALAEFRTRKGKTKK